VTRSGLGALYACVSVVQSEDVYRHTLKSSMGMKLSTPSSRRSSTLPSKVRARIRLSGRFLVVWAKIRDVASFFCEKKERGSESSNGRSSFFLLKDIEYGRLSAVCRATSD
jgi:hypothetical protein